LKRHWNGHAKQYGMLVYGYVVMPEHVVHMLVDEPERAALSLAMQSLKQSVSRT